MIQDYLSSLPIKDRKGAIEAINTQISEGSYNPLEIPKKMIFKRVRSSYFNGLQLSLTAGVGIGLGVVAVANPIIGIGAATLTILSGFKLSHDQWQDSQQALEEDDFGYLLSESEVLELQQCLKAMPEPKSPRIRKAVKVAQEIVEEELEEMDLGDYSDEVEVEAEEVENTTAADDADSIQPYSEAVAEELFESANVAMEDDPNYQEVSNPWDESKSADTKSA